MEAPDLTISTSESTKETVVETSKQELLQASTEFVSANWDSIAPNFEQFSEVEDNRALSMLELNNILAGLQTGYLTLWLGVKEDKIVGMFISSKHVGGPGGEGILYISYLMGFSTFEASDWQFAIAKLLEHAALKGCVAVVAHTSQDRLRDLAERRGANVDYRLTWRT